MEPKLTAIWNRFKSIVKRIYTGPWYKKIAVWICTLFFSVLAFFFAIDSNLFYLFGSTPDFDEIKDPTVSEASEVYSADGKLIGRYYNEDRTPVEYKDISPILIRTLVDTEDERFYHHHGIDNIGLFSAFNKKHVPCKYKTQNGTFRKEPRSRNPDYESKGMDCRNETGNDFRQRRDSDHVP